MKEHLEMVAPENHNTHYLLSNWIIPLIYCCPLKISMEFGHFWLGCADLYPMPFPNQKMSAP